MAGCETTSNSGQLTGDDLRAATLKAGSLTPCPDNNACVSSMATDDQHLIASFPLGPGDDQAVLGRLKKAVLSLPGAVVAFETPTYLHATFTSGLFRFMDDCELLIDRPRGAVQVRSASRFGQYDFGVNRQRVETIRETLANSSTQ